VTEELAPRVASVFQQDDLRSSVSRKPTVV